MHLSLPATEITHWTQLMLLFKISWSILVLALQDANSSWAFYLGPVRSWIWALSCIMSSSSPSISYTSSYALSASHMPYLLSINTDKIKGREWPIWRIVCESINWLESKLLKSSLSNFEPPFTSDLASGLDSYQWRGSWQSPGNKP